MYDVSVVLHVSQGYMICLRKVEQAKWAKSILVIKWWTNRQNRQYKNANIGQNRETIYKIKSKHWTNQARQIEYTDSKQTLDGQNMVFHSKTYPTMVINSIYRANNRVVWSIRCHMWQTLLDPHWIGLILLYPMMELLEEFLPMDKDADGMLSWTRHDDTFILDLLEWQFLGTTHVCSSTTIFLVKYVRPSYSLYNYSHLGVIHHFHFLIMLSVKIQNLWNVISHPFLLISFCLHLVVLCLPIHIHSILVEWSKITC